MGAQAKVRLIFQVRRSAEGNPNEIVFQNHNNNDQEITIGLREYEMSYIRHTTFDKDSFIMTLPVALCQVLAYLNSARIERIEIGIDQGSPLKARVTLLKDNDYIYFDCHIFEGVAIASALGVQVFMEKELFLSIIEQQKQVKVIQIFAQSDIHNPRRLM